MYTNVEVQIGQIVNSINNRNQGELPSKTKVNPQEHVKAITLCSGKQFEDPPMVENRRKIESEKQEDERVDQEESAGKCSSEKPREDQPSSSTTIPMPPTVSFPQRLKSNRFNKNFVKIFKQLHINIPFANTIL